MNLSTEVVFICLPSLEFPDLTFVLFLQCGHIIGARPPHHIIQLDDVGSTGIAFPTRSSQILPEG